MTNMEKKASILMNLLLGNDADREEKVRKAVLDLMQEHPTVKQTEVIHEILLELGAPCNNIGYDYVVKAIELVLEDKTYIASMTARLYPGVAAMFGTTAAKTERGIRHLIENIWLLAPMDVTKKYFGNTIHPNKGKPTNGQFIARIALTVRQRMGED